MEGRWMSEVNSGYGLTFKIRRELCSRQSRFQKIELFETENLGNLLMLDGIIQLCSFDEFAYHEMMVNLPFFAHRGTVRRALVVGGGDGGCLRELGRHPEIDEIDICEIDGEVIEVCREFLPETACGFDDPRVRIHLADGSEFIRKHAESYDLVIVDSTDPGGPGEPLFGDDFYRDLKRSLRPEGVICTQSESPWLFPETVADLQRKVRRFFAFAGYASIQVPTYPTGMIGASVASDGGDVTVPSRAPSPELGERLRYYDSAIHRGAFLNPGFAKRLILS